MKKQLSSLSFFKRTLTIIGIVLIAIALPATILMTRNRQTTFQQAASITPTTAVNRKISAPQATIEVISENPKFTAAIQNKDYLLKLLTSWGVFQKVVPVGTNGVKRPISKIVVRLEGTQQPIPVFQDKNAGGAYVSYKLEFAPEIMNYYIYIAPEKLLSNSSSSRSFLADFTFLKSVYNAYHPAYTEKELIDNGSVLRFLSESLLQEKKHFIVIEATQK